MNRHPHATVAQGAHRYACRVYYEDTDAAGTVYHANYLRLAERARTEALRELDIPHAEMTRLHGLIFMVRRAKLDYLAPARLDDHVIVATRPLAIGAASVVLLQSFHRAEQEEPALAVAEIQLACVRLADLRPARIPPRWRETLAKLGTGPGAARLPRM
jgi:acyl-CoA thioester hydrolase